MSQLSIVHVLSSFGLGGQECVALGLNLSGEGRIERERRIAVDSAIGW